MVCKEEMETKPQSQDLPITSYLYFGFDEDSWMK